MELETFTNPNTERPYIIQHIQEEFTSTCPKTGHPDFGMVVFTYVPDAVCLELKAMKEYLQGFRNEGIFYEAVTNRILDDLVAVTKPRWARVETIWKGRGGIRSVLTAEHSPAEYVGPVPQPFRP